MPSLAALTDSEDVGLVVTQPDRPKGRSGRPAPPKIKEFALSIGLDVIQPDSSEALKEGLESHGPFEVGVVVAYGRLLSPEVLVLPSRGMLNVHFSLLPRWRGAAPVGRALMQGDTMTGVTIIQLDEGLDTGPVLTAQALDIDPDDDLGALTERLANMGARLLIDSLPKYLKGSLRAVEQSDDGMTYAAKITSEDRALNVDTTPEVFLNHVRSLSPKPGATIGIDDSPHKILQVKISSHQMTAGSWAVVGGSVVIGVKGGTVEVVSLQPPGKNPQSGAEWARGRRVDAGRVE